MYFNDLANVFKKLKFVLFADDTNVLYTDKSLEKVTKVLNKELECMSIWFKVNKLSLNVEKTNYMIFKNNANNVNHKISINGIDIKRVNVTKFLGVHVNDKLKWDVQINSVCQKLSKNISILYKVKHILDNNSLYTLYCTLILPYFNYACEIWGNTYETNLKSLLAKKSH